MVNRSPDNIRYDRTTIVYHWATALLVAVQWLGAQTIDWFPRALSGALSGATRDPRISSSACSLAYVDRVLALMILFPLIETVLSTRAKTAP